MSDLIERLRKHGWDNAADRIEELEREDDWKTARIKLLQAENERLRDALIEITKFDPDFYNLAIQIALAALEDSDDE
jgi:hypothetical protein